MAYPTAPASGCGLISDSGKSDWFRKCELLTHFYYLDNSVNTAMARNNLVGIQSFLGTSLNVAEEPKRVLELKNQGAGIT